MKVSLLSNETNSLDPLAVNSRIFVGNLNTFEISKSDVEKIFQRYGHLTGIKIFAHGQPTIPTHPPFIIIDPGGECARHSWSVDINELARKKLNGYCFPSSSHYAAPSCCRGPPQEYPCTRDTPSSSSRIRWRRKVPATEKTDAWYLIKI